MLALLLEDAACCAEYDYQDDPEHWPGRQKFVPHIPYSSMSASVLGEIPLRRIIDDRASRRSVKAPSTPFSRFFVQGYGSLLNVIIGACLVTPPRRGAHATGMLRRRGLRRSKLPINHSSVWKNQNQVEDRRRRELSRAGSIWRRSGSSNGF